MSIKKFNQSLGSLEMEIMNIMWNLQKASVRDVLNKFKKKKKIAYTTIMTVMGRLCDKKILKRNLEDNGAYIYNVLQGKQEFYETASKKVINSLIKEFGEVAVAQFIDVIETRNIKNLKTWRKKLKDIK